MRVADKQSFEQVNANIGKNRQTMSELQNQAATQKRVTKPSDDPLAASRVLSHRVDLQGNQQFTKSLGYARSFLEYTDQSLSEITDTLVRAKELAIRQASDGSSGEETRRAVATEIDQLYNQLVQVGNRKLGDRFIFGGYRTQSAPFTMQGEYHGDEGEMLIHVDKDAFLAMNTPGSRVFMGSGFTAHGPKFVTPEQAMTIEELDKSKEEGKSPDGRPVEIRGPASLKKEGEDPDPVLLQAGRTTDDGVNLFRILRDLSTAMKTNDKAGIQDSLDLIDQGVSQVVLTRAQVGSRSTTLDNYTQSKEKEKVEDKIAISSLEDADIYSTVSDINKTESTLQATLQTSGKLIQKSLLDFIR
jgi:flagellar hook-associated protein 3 FlgL